jgi:hypothetical protein
MSITPHFTLACLRGRAAQLGVIIETDRDDVGWSYWLLDATTRNGVWDDDNFCTSLDEVDGKLGDLERERAAQPLRPWAVVPLALAALAQGA